MLPLAPQPTSTPFPYTTLFRSTAHEGNGREERGEHPEPPARPVPREVAVGLHTSRVSAHLARVRATPPVPARILTRRPHLRAPAAPARPARVRRGLARPACRAHEPVPPARPAAAGRRAAVRRCVGAPGPGRRTR